MTVLEQELAHVGKAAMKKYLQDKPIDWEQRRYEIAKELLPAIYERTTYINTENYTAEQIQGILASAAIEYADALITELKNTNQ